MAMYYIGGILKHARATLTYNSTANSYKVSTELWLTIVLAHSTEIGAPLLS